MTPAGFMAKRVVEKPGWLDAPHVVDVYSVSGCVAKEFSDYIPHWLHNGYWFFDEPQLIRQIAAVDGVSLAQCLLFFYEVHELEYDAEVATWVEFVPEPTLPVHVVVPESRQLAGYDVVSFSSAGAPECSPLTCNGLAARIPVNRHALFESLEQAVASLEAGRFTSCEPGPYRVFGVYTAQWTD